MDILVSWIESHRFHLVALSAACMLVAGAGIALASGASGRVLCLAAGLAAIGISQAAQAVSMKRTVPASLLLLQLALATLGGLVVLFSVLW
jgi:hypothetical protein